MVTLRQLAALKELHAVFSKALAHAQPFEREYKYCQAAFHRKHQLDQEQLAIAYDIRQALTVLTKAGFDTPSQWFLIEWTAWPKVLDADMQPMVGMPGGPAHVVSKGGDVQGIKRVLDEINVYIFKGSNQPKQKQSTGARKRRTTAADWIGDIAIVTKEFGGQLPDTWDRLAELLTCDRSTLFRALKEHGDIYRALHDWGFPPIVAEKKMMGGRKRTRSAEIRRMRFKSEMEDDE